MGENIDKEKKEEEKEEIDKILFDLTTPELLIPFA